MISSELINNKVSILEIPARLTDLAEKGYSAISDEFSRFGIEIVNFNIESVNIPEEDMDQIQDVFAKTMEARELSKVDIGGAFGAIKSFEVLNKAAENPGDGAGIGAMLGAGIGLGAGIPVGQKIGQNIDVSGNTESDRSPVERIRDLKALLDENLITEEKFNEKREEILKDM